MEIKKLVDDSYKIAKEHGWWNDNRSFPEAVMMIITELAEAVQEDRKGNRDKLPEELADVFIRLADLVGSLGIDIEPEIERKMEINKKRSYKHGRRY